LSTLVYALNFSHTKYRHKDVENYTSGTTITDCYISLVNFILSTIAFEDAIQLTQEAVVYVVSDTKSHTTYKHRDGLS